MFACVLYESLSKSVKAHTHTRTHALRAFVWVSTRLNLEIDSVMLRSVPLLSVTDAAPPLPPRLASNSGCLPVTEERGEGLLPGGLAGLLATVQ